MNIYGIIGAGGFAREVIPIADQMLTSFPNIKSCELVFVVGNPEDHRLVDGHKVISESGFVAMEAENKYFNIAIADGRTRERISNKMLGLGIKPFTIQAFTAYVSDNSEISEGAILSHSTTITSNAKLGRFFHLNIYSYVAHDCVIGDFVTFAPRVCCNGRVVIEDYAYIGTGAMIQQGTDEKPIIIGKGSVVGMGAVVTKSVLPFTVVVGNPAGPLNK